MRVLITGASSPLAISVLHHLVAKGDVEIWCSRHRNEVSTSSARLRVVDLDLESDESVSSLRTPFDMVLHFAGLTHALDERKYWNVNLDGTLRLAKVTRENGCRRFVYISTRCATPASGAYGESKLAAEQELQKLEWKSLLIIRPAEIYGGRGREGIDRMLEIAKRWRIVPLLWGNSNLSFAPLHLDDFSKLAVDLIERQDDGVMIVHACGPDHLSGLALGWRISRRYGAVPLPLWWPAVAVSLKALDRLGIRIVKPDQLVRLVVKKTAADPGDQLPRVTMRHFLSG
jgi:nucleoside-diphosphate-sugar epimerase